MLPELVKTIPQSMINHPGRALYSGRRAFAGPAELYIITSSTATPAAAPMNFPRPLGNISTRFLTTGRRSGRATWMNRGAATRRAAILSNGG